MANEKRLIDANALIAEIQSTASTVCLNAPWNADWFSRLADRQEEIVAMIERQPTVDAVEVVHGRWEKAHISGYLKCNCCNDAFIYEEWLESGKWNYCPNCGAKMDGGLSNE